MRRGVRSLVGRSAFRLMAYLERATFGSPTCTACQSLFSFSILLSDIVPLRSIARPLKLFVQGGRAGNPGREDSGTGGVKETSRHTIAFKSAKLGRRRS